MKSEHGHFPGTSELASSSPDCRSPASSWHSSKLCIHRIL